MPKISGHVYYDANRTTVSVIGIQNVPVVLYNSTLATGAVALTDATGFYEFTNVPAGSYQIVEAWGALGGMPTPVNYLTNVASMPAPIEKEPPLSAVSVPVSPLADKLDAVTPNMLFATAALLDITAQNFYDGPVGNKPLLLNGVTKIGANLITAADNGTWGSVAAGSPVGTAAPSDPYPGVTTGFIYSQSSTPPDGYYSVINTRALGNPQFLWWRYSDHTTGLETGRSILVNSDNPGANIFRQTITVEPNTDYLASAWIMNVVNVSGAVNPQVAFEVVASDNTVIINQPLNSISNSAVPIWYQVGSMFNSGAYTSVTVKVVSVAPFSPVGNDYTVDDVELYKVKIEDLLKVTKVADPYAITVGEEITYTATLKNIGPTVVLDAGFIDILSSNLQFVPGSVLVNGSGAGYATANPNTGFSVGNIAVGASTTVAFKALVLSDAVNPIPNTPYGVYPFLQTANGDIFKNSVKGNTVYTPITKYNLRQSSRDVVESIALQQTALSHILNAEGEKIQKALALNASNEDLLKVNQSVNKMVQAISNLEIVLKSKLKQVRLQATGIK